MLVCFRSHAVVCFCLFLFADFACFLWFPCLGLLALFGLVAWFGCLHAFRLVCLLSFACFLLRLSGVACSCCCFALAFACLRSLAFSGLLCRLLAGEATRNCFQNELFLQSACCPSLPTTAFAADRCDTRRFDDIVFKCRAHWLIFARSKLAGFAWMLIRFRKLTFTNIVHIKTP